MRVLYLGKFRYFYSTENYISAALKHAGCDVIKLNYDSSEDKVLKKLKHFDADFVLFSKPSAPHYGHLLNTLKQMGILTVCWQFDLFFGFGRKPVPQFAADLLFTTDGGHQEAFTKAGFGHHQVLRQGIHSPEYFMVNKVHDGFDHEVAFVGNPSTYPYRAALVDWLRRTYGNRFVLHTHTRGVNLNKALSRVKLVVGDSFPSKNYWSNRIYEILGRGGVLLHPKTEGLDEEFTAGEHYADYDRNNYEALRETIERLRQDDDQREQMRLLGWMHCGRYTYDVRVRRLLSAVGDRIGVPWRRP